MSSPGPNWYDVLDVDPSASTDEIREAWRAAIADLTPADRRFRLYNRAAEVLLDPEQRAAHDAELAREEAPAETPAPGPADSVTRPGAEERVASQRRSRREALAGLGAGLGRAWRNRRTRRTRPGSDTRPGGAARTGWLVPRWLLIVVAVLAALSVGVAAYLWTQPSPATVEDSARSARTAAERAVVTVLSYDYETLEEDQAAAHEVVTSGYRADYDELFAVIEENAPSTRTKVGVQVLASSITRVDAEGERVEVLLFVDRPTTNRVTEQPVVYKDQVTATMQRVDGEWLVDDLKTSPAQQ